MKTLLLSILSLLSITAVTAQNNLLDLSTWTEGTGSVTGFIANETTSGENVREMGTGPLGNSVLLWKAVPDAESEADGGWDTEYVQIDATKTYRFSVWIKKTNSNDGTTYFGLNARDASLADKSLRLDGTVSSNPYFYINDLPALDTWYLLVGYIHDSSYSLQVHEGGIYSTDGTKVGSLTDFKFGSGADRIIHRAYLYYDTNTSDRQYFYYPTVYEVNGSEPSLAELLNPNSGSTGTGAWSQNGTDLYYNDGNVGIGTGNTDAKLTVKGNIHAEEVKVDLSVPAPDYVFKEDYPLRSVEQIAAYIHLNGHLPDMPSAKVMESEGIELGEMNMRLLRKIEELTLYLIDQQMAIEKKDKQLKDLESRIIKMEKENTKK